MFSKTASAVPTEAEAGEPTTPIDAFHSDPSSPQLSLDLYVLPKTYLVCLCGCLSKHLKCDMTPVGLTFSSKTCFSEWHQLSPNCSCQKPVDVTLDTALSSSINHHVWSILPTVSQACPRFTISSATTLVQALSTHYWDHHSRLLCGIFALNFVPMHTAAKVILTKQIWS